MKHIEKLLELPIKIILNNQILSDILCTPQDIDLLCIGWLLSEGLVKDYKDITRIRFNSDCSTVYIEAKCNSLIKSLSLKVSETLKKDINISKIYKKKISTELLDVLYKYGNILQDAQVKGLHGALLYNKDNTYIIQQDISRHCAIDKVIGYSIKHNVNIEKSMLFTTGRISSEFISKALNANISVIASIKYPSITAEIVAKDWGINIASHILTDKITVYPARTDLELSFDKIFLTA
ncbi:hypothetical protein AN640_01315 [Candidatus Epulonipiscium fishelsonii]|uniref:Uncharacterized protein n=1 Tax=Candidatus Epulonipiscium fishelsonii TaxID=77094 RepID=A0ACC8XF40_9FIRM|nr:hypothetical protein AN640_01315 [Epulopiscium sp. SCG-D08WGA-EpuloA1]OON97306.1 MAG: hypothetical protein ATN32_05690 [Epulopiscium sp. AS2M-Bin002]